MKNLSYCTLCFCLMLALSCKKDDLQLANNINASEEVALELFQQANFKEGNFSIKFTQLIEDTRCPIGAQCYGVELARVRMTINENGLLSEFDLCTDDLPDLKASEKFTYGNYEIKLQNVLPYPTEINESTPASEAVYECPPTNYITETQVSFVITPLNTSIGSN